MRKINGTLYISEGLLLWIVGLLAAVILLLSCKDRTDVQPPQSEVVTFHVNGVDTSIIVTDSSRTIIIDSVLQTPPEIIIPELPSEIITVAYVDKDSLLESIYMSQVGVRELTGNNDGPDVLKYQKAAGLTSGYSWCACFVLWCFKQADIKTPITAWSPTCHNKNNIVMMNGTYRKELRRGDVFTLYFPKMKRIGHTGFVRRKFGSNSVETVEGNTNSAGSREGDGVYVKIRPKSSIYSISRWIKE